MVQSLTGSTWARPDKDEAGVVDTKDTHNRHVTIIPSTTPSHIIQNIQDEEGVHTGAGGVVDVDEAPMPMLMMIHSNTMATKATIMDVTPITTTHHMVPDMWITPTYQHGPREVTIIPGNHL